MTQLALNSKHFDIIKMTSFYVNFERESNLLNFRQSEILVDAAEKQIKTLRIVHNNIIRMHQHFFKFVNKKRKIASLLKKRNKVYLFTKNLKMKKSSKKLNLMKIGLFFIKKIKELKIYELNLLKRIKVFSVFDISLSKSVDLSTFIQKTFHFELDDEKLYTVKRILEKKNQQYLIKWEKYLYSNNTWESFKNLMNCQQHLKNFHRQKENHSINVESRISVRRRQSIH